MARRGILLDIEIMRSSGRVSGRARILERRDLKGWLSCNRLEKMKYWAFLFGSFEEDLELILQI
jgi:hypothetical protein